MCGCVYTCVYNVCMHVRVQVCVCVVCMFCRTMCVVAGICEWHVAFCDACSVRQLDGRENLWLLWIQVHVTSHFFGFFNDFAQSWRWMSGLSSLAALDSCGEEEL